LAGLFWGETSDARARHNLTRELSQLTARLPDCFQADYHTVRWAPADPACVDIADCAAQLAHDPGRAAATPIDDLRALGDAPLASDTWFASAGADRRDPARLRAAVALYRGEFLAGLYFDGCPEFETWLIREREYWRLQVTGALDALIAHHALRHADDQAQICAALAGDRAAREDAHRYLFGAPGALRQAQPRPGAVRRAGAPWSTSWAWCHLRKRSRLRADRAGALDQPPATRSVTGMPVG
jgi:hypothetical protein